MFECPTEKRLRTEQWTGRSLRAAEVTTTRIESVGAGGFPSGSCWIYNSVLSVLRELCVALVVFWFVRQVHRKSDFLSTSCAYICTGLMF